jgi:septal ring factor EnvC (AmiA/AmiB activator)
MSQYDDLKRLVEACVSSGEYLPGAAWEEDRRYSPAEQAFLAFAPVATPAAVLALLADLDQARNGMKHQAALGLKKEIERLNADNASLKGSCSQLGAEHTGMARALKTANRLLTEANAERDRLKTEVEALRKERDKLADENRSLLEDPGSAL